jgi:hypothetical protein
MWIEWWWTNDILVRAKLVETNEGFDHEFGREERTGLEVDSLHVIHYIENIDWDLTKGYPEWKIEDLKKEAIQRRLGRAA